MWLALPSAFQDCQSLGKWKQWASCLQICKRSYVFTCLNWLKNNYFFSKNTCVYSKLSKGQVCKYLLTSLFLFIKKKMKTFLLLNPTLHISANDSPPPLCRVHIVKPWFILHKIINVIGRSKGILITVLCSNNG